MDPTNYTMNKNRKKADNFVDGVREHGKPVTFFFFDTVNIKDCPDFNYHSFVKLQ